MAKAKVICSKCGATGKSKCPYCRTVFPDNQYEALLSHIFVFSVVKEGRITRAKINYVIDPDWSPEEAWDHIHDIFHNIEIKMLRIKELMCEHDFRFAPGEVSEIGCGHENLEELPPGVYEGSIIDVVDKGNTLAVTFKVDDREFKATLKRQEP